MSRTSFGRHNGSGKQLFMDIVDETLGFLNQTPRLMLNHVCNSGGALDFADTKTLLTKGDQE
jgi:hypothetical protein